MLPAIKSGDVLEISPQVQDIAVGDILLYRNSIAEAVVHRMIGRVERASQAFILVKGDASCEPDEFISQDQILGKVIDIHTKNTLSLHGFVSLIFHRLQSFGVYAKLAKAFIQPKKQFKFEVKEEAGITQFSLKKQGRVVGYAELSMDIANKNTWILSSLWVHCIYRRAGIGERIVREALEYSNKKRAKEIRLFISKLNFAAMALYKKLGFILVNSVAPHGYGRDFIQLKRDVENASCDTSKVWN